MRLKFTFLITIFSFVLYAQTAPAYYSNVNFSKKNNELKNELATLISNTHKKNNIIWRVEDSTCK